MKRRMFLLVVALTMVISMIPSLAFASDDTFQADITVTKGEDVDDVSCTFKITKEVDENGHGGEVQVGTGLSRDCAILQDTAGKLTIPSTVTKGNYTYTVTSLGAYCFYDCSSLESTGLETNSKVTTLGDWCFYMCKSLESTGLETNSTVTTLGAYCFYGCKSLESTGLETNSTVTTLGAYFFYGCSSLESAGLETNSTVTTLGKHCFNGCSSLESTGLETNSTVTTLEVECFSNCKSLESTGLETNSTVTTLGDWCFYSCRGIVNAALPKSLKHAPNQPFYGCKNIKTVYVAGNYLDGIDLFGDDAPTDPITVYYRASEASWDGIGEGTKTITKAGTYTPLIKITAKGGNITNLPANPWKRMGLWTENETVTITAAVPVGHIFDQWTSDNGEVVFDDPAKTSTTFKAPLKDTTVTGMLIKNTYAVSASASPSKGGTVTGAKKVAYGGSITLKAKANAGYTFSKWIQNGKTVGKSKTLTVRNVKEAREYVAVFTKSKYTIKAVASPSKGGTVTKTKTVPYEGKVTLKVKAKKGYKFVKWTEKKKTVSTKKTLRVKNIKKNHTYKAVFKKVPVDFTLKAKGSTIKVRWETVKGAAGYQIANSNGGNKIKIWWTGSNGNNTYTSLHKKNGKTYKFKMRYYKVKDGKRVWSKWTEVKSIKK